MANGIWKNIERVKEGFTNMFKEWAEIPYKLQQAWPNPFRMLHHLSGYYEAWCQHPYKFHFYMTPIRWGIIGTMGYLIWKYEVLYLAGWL